MKRGLIAGLALLAVPASGKLAAQSATCAEPGFVAPDRYAIAEGFGPQAAADVTGEGLPDLVGLQGGNAEPAILVLPGLADGGFGAPISTPIVTTGVTVLADFTGEGLPDVLISQNSYPFFGLVLHAGNGDGTFQPAVEVVDYTSGDRIHAADVDGDGKNDIVMASGPWIEVFLNEGAGSFAGPFRTPAWSPDFVLGEVDGDGILDLVGTRPEHPALPGVLVYYPGRADGTFNPSHDIAPGSFRSVRVGDLNGDGHLDVVGAQDFAIVAVLGHGDGSFEPAVQSFAPPGPKRFELADLNSDGFADLVVAQADPYSYATGMEVMLGAGDGAFVRGSGYPVRDPSFLIADFGNDGSEDVAVVTSSIPDLLVFRGNGDGSLRGPRVFGLSSPILAIVSGDFNEDGRPDIADVFYYGGTIISVSFGGPRGDFRGGGTFSLNIPMSSLATADVNGDGHLDLATLSFTESTMPVLLGDGHGQFALISNSPTQTLTYTSRLLLEDLNGDDKADAVVVSLDPNAHADQIAILLGNGNASFGAASPLSLPSPVLSLTIADVTEDGVPDLVAAGSEVAAPAGTLYVLRGLGNGTFGPPEPLDTMGSPIAIVAADLVEDGHPDLAVGGGDAALWIYPGLGGGAFGDPILVNVGGPVYDFAARDFQGDGHLDLFATTYPNAHVAYGDGQGGFGTPQPYFVGGGFQSQSLLTGDFDGNSTTDVVVSDSSFFGGGYVLLQNAVLAVGVAEVSAPAPGQSMTLVAEASGLGSLAYQWRRDGIALSDGGAVSGSQAATLTIDPVAFGDAGSYDVVVTDSCGEVTSNAVPLAVEFADVPVSSPFHDDILTIATEGIAAGCGGGNYCPTLPVRRDQMAVFLLKSEHGSDYSPPPCSGVFDDVPCPGPFADWVEQLAAEGVTGGCGTGVYCPGQSVTRAQMAVFLLKTKEGSAYVPPPATGTFGDVPVGSFAADFIEELYDRGITGGCSTSPLLYCPGHVVLRQQMATFLVRTFLP